MTDFGKIVRTVYDADTSVSKGRICDHPRCNAATLQKQIPSVPIAPPDLSWPSTQKKFQDMFEVVERSANYASASVNAYSSMTLVYEEVNRQPSSHQLVYIPYSTTHNKRKEM